VHSVRGADRIRVAWLMLVFFVSGFPAMVYQLVWQRCLFTLYGINVEAVALVVTGFMVGLGFGSLFGGWLSRRVAGNELIAFAAIECGTGALGIVSLPVFDAIGAYTLSMSTAATSVFSLALLLVPTLLMGATLPLLVSYLVARSGNVGRSVGSLYFVNTMGSAVACFAAAAFLMARFGMDGSTHLAAALNVLVSLGALLVGLRDRRSTAGARVEALRRPPGPRDERYTAALLLACVTGFLALSYEILWFRAVSFATGGLAPAFAITLGSYLAGIAVGSLASRRCCLDPEGGGTAQVRALAMILLASAVLGQVLVPAVAQTAVLGKAPQLTVAAMLICLHGALSGAAFPLVSHLGIRPGQDSGSLLSHVYMANIVGSAIGSLATGFILLDLLPMATLCGGLSVVGIVFGLGLMAWAGMVRVAAVVPAGAAISAALVATTPSLWRDTWEKLMFGDYDSDNRFTDVVENRHGVITVDRDRIVYGGGMYDGRISIDAVRNLNGLQRPLAVPAFHPAPRRMLMIGLSTGAWAEILAALPGLERFDIVEINPGYLALIGHYEDVRPLLTNPKVHIYIDDGRKWLNKNVDLRYDVIIQNTTLYFRANITNLVSTEYLGIVAGHLAEGGLFYYNTQGSMRPQRTACLANPRAFRFDSMMVVPVGAAEVDPGRWAARIAEWQVAGRPLLDPSDPAAALRLGAIKASLSTGSVRAELENCESILARSSHFTAITDRNMGDEWDPSAEIRRLLSLTGFAPHPTSLPAS
jgi:spermidine synthase